MVLDAGDSLDLIRSGQFTPNEEHAVYPVPLNVMGGKNNGRTREDNRCDDGPGVSSTGHAVYLPRERYYDTFEERYECRATGAYALLDGSDYNYQRQRPGTNTNSSTQPPGMNEIRALGQIPANGHLIPAVATGSGIDLRNLVAQYQKTNTPYLSNGVELDIRRAVRRGETVFLSVVPHYGNEGSGVPTTIEYNYSVVGSGTSNHCVIRQTPTVALQRAAQTAQGGDHGE